MSPVNHVDPVFVSCVVDARVLLKSPTTVDDACETKPVPKVPSPVNVDAPVTPSVPLNEPVPPVKVPTAAVLLKRFVELAVVLKSAVEVAFVKVTLPLNVFTPLQVFEFASKVEDAAVTVIAVPGTTLVPLIVPKEVVAKTRPLPSVARRAFARLLICRFVVVAFTASVEEAINCVPFNHKGVVVL